MLADQLMSRLTRIGRGHHGPYEELQAAVRRERDALLAHPLYAAVADASKLRVFMEAHVFAVWDFMSLLKALQRRLTCIDVPWVPPRSRTAARLINEIVLAEESDTVGPATTMSHFELYLDAMHEVGADTSAVDAFVVKISGGSTPDAALDNEAIPVHARHFVMNTLTLAGSDDVEGIAAAFLIGREDLVPAMFRRLLPVVDKHGKAPSLRRYLERHIEVDEGEHGPLARQLLLELCGGDQERWARAATAARRAIAARLRLWDAVLHSW